MKFQLTHPKLPILFVGSDDGRFFIFAIKIDYSVPGEKSSKLKSSQYTIVKFDMIFYQKPSARKMTNLVVMMNPIRKL